MKKYTSPEFTTVVGSDNAPSNLTVAMHGLTGNVVDQLSPVLGTVQDHSSASLLVQEQGLYHKNGELVAATTEKTARLLATKAFGAVTFLGFSKGGAVGTEVFKELQAEGVFDEYSVTPHITLVDTPSGASDIAKLPEGLRRHPRLAKKVTGGVLAALAPFDEFMNRIGAMKKMAEPPNPKRFEEDLTEDQKQAIKDEFTRMSEVPFSMWRTQLASIMAQDTPELGSLDDLSSLAYVHSTDGEDVVIGEDAIRTWGRTVGPNKYSIIHAKMPHAAPSQAPKAGNHAIQRSFRWHETRRDYMPIISE